MLKRPRLSPVSGDLTAFLREGGIKVPPLRFQWLKSKIFDIFNFFQYFVYI